MGVKAELVSICRRPVLGDICAASGLLLVERPPYPGEAIGLGHRHGVDKKASGQPANQTALRHSQLPRDERQNDHEELQSEPAAWSAAYDVSRAGQKNRDRQYGVGMQRALHSGRLCSCGLRHRGIQ